MSQQLLADTFEEVFKMERSLHKNVIEKLKAGSTARAPFASNTYKLVDRNDTDIVAKRLLNQNDKLAVYTKELQAIDAAARLACKQAEVEFAELLGQMAQELTAEIESEIGLETLREMARNGELE